MFKRISLFVLIASCISFAVSPGITETEVLLGQSCALSGPAQALGQGMRAGLNCYFAKVNAEGGINGRKIRMISKDDGYEPARAQTNTTALVEQDKVFLLIGEVGTPTSQAVVPYTIQKNVPFFAPFTGAEFLRTPFKKNVINVRGSYFQEMERLADYLVNTADKKRIACFYQYDGYGKAGLNGLTKALAAKNMEVVSAGAYTRNTVDVEPGMLKVLEGNPDAVVMVGAYKPCAAFIKKAESKLPNATFCNISFVGTDALINELAGAGNGSIVSQVVKFPYDQSTPLVKEYTAAMKSHAPSEKIGFVSLEGYMAGKLFCNVLSKVEGEITRDKFIATLEKIGTFDLGGVTLTYGANDHQGMDDVFLTMIKNGKIEQLK